MDTPLRERVLARRKPERWRGWQTWDLWKNSSLGPTVSFFFQRGHILKDTVEKDTVELAGERGFVAMEDAEAGAVFVHFLYGAEGARGERPFEHFGGCIALGVDLVREADGCHGPDSHLIPFAVDHFFDQHEFAFVRGSSSRIWLLSRRSNSSGDSPVARTVLARRAWRMLLRPHLAFPSSVVGPWERAPLAREAATWASERCFGSGGV
jgi:hypothetical protein